jgi:hypothetical protein
LAAKKTAIPSPTDLYYQRAFHRCCVAHQKNRSQSRTAVGGAEPLQKAIFSVEWASGKSPLVGNPRLPSRRFRASTSRAPDSARGKPSMRRGGAQALANSLGERYLSDQRLRPAGRMSGIFNFTCLAN